MPLPIRPLSEPSSGEPAESKLPSPPAPVDESSALPSLDFGGPVEEETEEGLPGLPALEEDLYSGGLPPMEEYSNPPRDVSLEDLPPLPDEELSNDEFDDLFNDFEDTTAAPAPPPAAPPAPPALPEPTNADDDEFDDMDFDSLFNEEAETTQVSLPPAPIEESAEPQEEDDEDDWGFDDLEDNPKSSKAKEFDDSLFEEEEPSALPAMDSSAEKNEQEEDDSKDSWDTEFDKFMEDDDESEAENSENEDEEIPEDALAPLKKDGKSKKKPKHRGKRKGGAKAQNPILRSLAAIPILGLLFRPLLKLGSIGVAILGLIPLLIIPLVIFLIASNSVPGGNSITGPDSAAASIADFSLSGDKATATVTNSGEVVADVTATFTVWSYNPLGGGSIFAFDEVGSCIADEVSVDIDASATVTTTCEPPAGGLMTKLSGSISY